MIVYHGSTQEIQSPDILFCKQFSDFGRGFYVTTFKEQAENWAKRKALRQKKQACVSIYEFTEKNDSSVLRFSNQDVEWLDFVFECRKGSDLYTQYDIIIGGVADDDVYKVIDLFFEGIWSKEQALQELRYYKVNDQISFVKQEALEKALTFQNSYMV